MILLPLHWIHIKGHHIVPLCSRVSFGFSGDFWMRRDSVVLMDSFSYPSREVPRSMPEIALERCRGVHRIIASTIGKKNPDKTSHFRNRKTMSCPGNRDCDCQHLRGEAHVDPNTTIRSSNWFKKQLVESDAIKSRLQRAVTDVPDVRRVCASTYLRCFIVKRHILLTLSITTYAATDCEDYL